MHLKQFSSILILRLGLLLTTMVGLALIAGRADLFFNQVILGLLLIVQVVGLIRHVRKTNRDLAKFLFAIKEADFTIHFGQESDQSFQSLHAAFREILDSYRQMSADREVQYQYLQSLVSHINVGIISLRDDEIVLINPSALKLLCIEPYRYWHHLQRKYPTLAQEVAGLQEGESKLVELTVSEEKKRLLVQARSVILMTQSYRIITLQDIEQEMNQSEIDAYHRLIRLLTHEIMNSITPIASLSETLLMMLQDEQGETKSWNEVGEAYLKQLNYSLQTISKRSDGLLHFVEDYRKLTKVPQLHPEVVPVRALLQTIGQLMRTELQQKKISLDIQVQPQEATVWGDARLIEQVLINLVTNSIFALASTASPCLTLSSYPSQDQQIIEVTDNGAGIEPDKIDQIFVPFFSTKEQGAGIGLSLSRHIMALHRGTIKAQSRPSVQTSFFLSFRVGTLGRSPLFHEATKV